jgi:transposase
MSKALSLDLRVRVLGAVHAGASHREAGERFGVSAASVSRWRTREREQGEARPKALGGDRRSKRIEACHDTVMAALGSDRDATIEEVRQALSAQNLVFGFGTIQRFFVRHAITRKKRRPTPRSRIVPMSPSGAKAGSRDNSTSIPNA